ncbi:MAG TPA: arsenate reductase ArsC [Novimethylophilus sp.]|jgi:arsenate reductase|uniref:arsenate reductase ArsC n=1 Tax=Novimethylophilus sp. TaxID=2137426 RepID=UPI002F40E750
MQGKIYTVLFLCTGNSARSIMAEKLLEHWGKGRFRTFSAGSHPSGMVNPFAIELLESKGLSTDGLRSKSWDEFAVPGAPQLDFVFTVCGNAAGEVCPIWPGQPMSAHWGVEDPAAAQGSDKEKRQAFRKIASYLENRIKIFTSLPLASLDKMSIKREIDTIGKLQDV